MPFIPSKDFRCTQCGLTPTSKPHTICTSCCDSFEAEYEAHLEDSTNEMFCNPVADAYWAQDDIPF